MNGALLQAKLLGAKARIEAIKCGVAGMIAENEARSRKDEAVAYGEGAFFQAQERLNELAALVKQLGDEYARSKGWLWP